MLPDPTGATFFWNKIWSEEVGHNEGASWLEDAEVELSTREVQEDISINVEDIRNGVSKMANWKAAGPELVQGFWFKDCPLDCKNSCKTLYIKGMYQNGWSGEEEFSYKRTQRRVPRPATTPLLPAYP